MMNSILLATHNEHKTHEIEALFSEKGLKYRVLSLGGIGDIRPIPEEGATLEANALAKAREAKKRHGGNVLSDDTGLEVHALGGAPGVYSARYAGEYCTSDENIEKLLTELSDSMDRRATFRTVLALILDDQEYIFSGEVRGVITTERKGERGFGYDPVFLPDGHDMTFAQLSEQEKNKISHRGLAIVKLIDFLKGKDQVI